MSVSVLKEPFASFAILLILFLMINKSNFHKDGSMKKKLEGK